MQLASVVVLILIISYKLYLKINQLGSSLIKDVESCRLSQTFHPPTPKTREMKSTLLGPGGPGGGRSQILSYGVI